MKAIDQLAADMAAEQLRKKIIYADERCNRALADANRFAECGQKEKAERLYALSGYWRDRYNKLKGDA